MTRAQLMAMLMFMGATITAIAAGVAFYYETKEVARLKAELEATQ